MAKSQDSIVDFPDMQTIREQAALWAVRVQGYTYNSSEGIPAQEMDSLKQWLALSERHREAFITMAAGWDAMADMEQLAEFLPLSDFAPPQKQRGKIRTLWSNWVTGLAWPRATFASAVMACMVLVTTLFITSQDSGIYQTAVGEQLRLTLDDGSRVILNTDSQLQVDFSQQRRAVTLLKGEAHFEVAKNPERPFMVYADQGMVWAVGTAFTVHYRQDYVDVTVTEGRVKVYSEFSQSNNTPPLNARLPDPQPEPREALLLAGEQAAYKKAILTHRALAPSHLEKKLAWHAGALVFEGETLAQAIEQISRYTSKQLIIADPALNDLTVGGRFKTDDIDGLLMALAISLNLKIEAGKNNRLYFMAQ